MDPRKWRGEEGGADVTYLSGREQPVERQAQHLPDGPEEVTHLFVVAKLAEDKVLLVDTAALAEHGAVSTETIGINKYRVYCL